MKHPSERAARGVLEAMELAQRLAFGPMLFHAALLLRDRGLLGRLSGRGALGRTVDELSDELAQSRYAVTVLVEAGLAAGLLVREGERYRATRAGVLVARDPLTRVNMNFVADVCYRAAEHLGASLDAGRPVGLSELGDWSTVYEGLSQLPERARTSWLEFDHFYSDDTFPLVLPEVLAGGPTRVLDVGGNTGKFARAALGFDAALRVTVADLPTQLELCRAANEEAGLGGQVDYYPVDLRRSDARLPAGHEVLWMSQFLCCFSEVEVVHILSLARRAMTESALNAPPRLFVLDNLWDRQPNPVGELCLQATSLYFTCVANGQSRMYDSATLSRLVGEAGLEVVSERHGIGWGHSLLEYRAR